MLKETRELLDRSLEDCIDVLQVLAEIDRTETASEDDIERFCAVASFRALNKSVQIKEDGEALHGFSHVSLDEHYF